MWTARSCCSADHAAMRASMLRRLLGPHNTFMIPYQAAGSVTTPLPSCEQLAPPSTSAILHSSHHTSRPCDQSSHEQPADRLSEC